MENKPKGYISATAIGAALIKLVHHLKQAKFEYNDGTLRKICNAASHAFALQRKADLATA
jgi:hypothetical protein